MLEQVYVDLIERGKLLPNFDADGINRDMDGIRSRDVEYLVMRVYQKFTEELQTLEEEVCRLLNEGNDQTLSDELRDWLVSVCVAMLKSKIRLVATSYFLLNMLVAFPIVL